MFVIQEKPLCASALSEPLHNPKVGAWLSFEGRVRSEHLNKTVLHLDYEAYNELALKEVELIFSEAKEQFQIIEVTGAHRVGRLNVGELALWVAVGAKHRKEAFKAIEFIIDEIKARLPIWKKEFFADGTSLWVDCRDCLKHHVSSLDEKEYYKRQEILPEFALEGQNRLKNARVLIVGVGGLGCPALVYLAGAGIGEITICDGDSIQVSNLHRQFLYSTQNLGELKVDIAKEYINSMNPLVTIQTEAVFLTKDNCDALIEGYDIVLDCVDTVEAKFLLHDRCRAKNIPLLQAGIYRFEGSIQLFYHQKDEACLRCLWPQIPQNSSSCTASGILGSVAGVIGTMQATEAIKFLLQLKSVIKNEMLVFNLLNWDISRFVKKKNPSCILCSERSEASERPLREEWELDTLLGYELVDIRTLDLGDLETEKFQDGRNYLLACQKGIRSKNIVDRLRRRGFKQFYSLLGGMHSLELVK